MNPYRSVHAGHIPIEHFFKYVNYICFRYYVLTLQKEVAKQIKKTQRKEKKTTIKKMDEMARAAGYGSAAEMVAGSGRSERKDKGIKAPPMYKHPTEDKTWTGKGRTPDWMKEYEKKRNKKREDLLIDK
ncbi:MAG: H-NS histone family protein [Magnetococcales bacterium]|nr:H-NS histone family protein [Magnetococcales bacterium]